MSFGRSFYWCPNDCGKEVSHQFQIKQGLFKCSKCNLEIQTKKKVLEICK